VLSAVMLTHFMALSQNIMFLLVLLGVAIALAARHIRLLGLIPLLFFIAILSYFFSIKASNDRIWWQGLERLAQIEIHAEQIKINNLRNFSWHSHRESDLNWQSRVYDLSKLTTLELIIEPFEANEYIAHTMLSFGFGEQGHVVVSVEARKEVHENYSLLAGALRQFELIYIFGDERDLFGLRAVQRNAKLYLYPIRAEQKFIQNLFKQLVVSANDLHHKPQFYKSIRSNCTTTLVKHIDQNLEHKIGLRYQTLLPGLAGELLYDLGYMDTKKSFSEMQRTARIDAAVREYIKEPNFSAKIRQ